MTSPNFDRISPNLERIFELIREAAEDCQVVSVYFQGFDSMDEMRPKRTHSFHREPLNATAQVTKGGDPPD